MSGADDRRGGPLTRDAVRRIAEGYGTQPDGLYFDPEDLDCFCAAIARVSGAEPPPPQAAPPLTNFEIRAICRQHGFKLRPQPDGREDLNPYVYDAVRACIEAARQLWAGTP